VAQNALGFILSASAFPRLGFFSRFPRQVRLAPVALLAQRLQIRLDRFTPALPGQFMIHLQIHPGMRRRRTPARAAAKMIPPKNQKSHPPADPPGSLAANPATTLGF
jgi:hypothetical protein